MTSMCRTRARVAAHGSRYSGAGGRVMTSDTRQPIRVDLAGQVALISGAAGHIGRATCPAFARAGAPVLATDVAAEGLAETVRLIRDAGGTVHGVMADMASGA